MCARYFLCFQVHTVSPEKVTPEMRIQNLTLSILYPFKHIWKSVRFLIKR